MQIVQYSHQIYLLFCQPPSTVKLGSQICFQTFYEPEKKKNFDEIGNFVYLDQHLLFCNGPVHVARLGDDFVAKIADQSSQVL